MLEHRTVIDLAEGECLPPDELYLVRGADMARWAHEAARHRAAVETERAACRRIVEDRLRLMLEERRADPVLLVRGILAAIDARARGSAD
jgi:hypothetical protein